MRIDNDIDFEAIVAAETLKADLSRKLITGDKDTAGEFDGLEQLVNTGYVDVKTGALNAGIDSTIVAWASVHCCCSTSRLSRAWRAET